MKGYLYYREKPLDRIVRCYLTLDCTLQCGFCSAGVPKLFDLIKPKPISPDQWAEGLNARNRYTILAGGEPFLYPYWPELISMLDSTYKIEIYSNLTLPVDGFVRVAKKSYSFLVSLHDCDFEAWHRRVEFLRAAGHGVRVHIVKVGNWQRRREFLRVKGYDGKIKITGCGDQGSGVKSKYPEANIENPVVTCKMQAYFFGPDGYRYPCVTLLGKGEKKLEHILDADGEDAQIIECRYYGLCMGCDNNASGWVKKGILWAKD